MYKGAAHVTIHDHYTFFCIFICMLCGGHVWRENLITAQHEEKRKKWTCFREYSCELSWSSWIHFPQNSEAIPGMIIFQYISYFTFYIYIFFLSRGLISVFDEVWVYLVLSHKIKKNIYKLVQKVSIDIQNGNASRWK